VLCTKSWFDGWDAQHPIASFETAYTLGIKLQMGMSWLDKLFPGSVENVWMSAVCMLQFLQAENRVPNDVQRPAHLSGQDVRDPWIFWGLSSISVNFVNNIRTSRSVPFKPEVKAGGVPIFQGTSLMPLPYCTSRLFQLCAMMKRLVLMYPTWFVTTT
jgi:hypothetical protein